MIDITFPTMTASDVIGWSKRGVFKFVRLEDGSFKFLDMDEYPLVNHKDMLDANQLAIAGGMIAIPERGIIHLLSDRSDSLGVSCHPRDLAALRYVLKSKIVNK